MRFNTERASSWKVALEPSLGWRLTSGLREIDSSHCAGVWWRRPETPARPEGADIAEWEAVREQWRALLAALVSVRGPRWVSRPDVIAQAENKAVQLAAAAHLGLPAPPTLWTNDRTEAERFLARHGGRGVVKSVATAYWQTKGRSHFVFAKVLGVSELPEVARLASAPLAFQPLVAPKTDIRVTVIGQRVLAARRTVVAGTSGTGLIDWRLQDRAEWIAHSLPLRIGRRCRGLTKALGLRFAGIDLVLDQAAKYWFIEANPNGEWGWLQKAGLPIAEALADELLG